MGRVPGMRARLTRQAQLRWTQFWRWFRTSSRRTQVAVAVSTLIGVVVISSLAVAAFHIGARHSGTSSQAGTVPAATSGSAPHSTPRPTATTPRHGRGHGHHKSHIWRE